MSTHDRKPPEFVAPPKCQCGHLEIDHYNGKTLTVGACHICKCTDFQLTPRPTARPTPTPVEEGIKHHN